MENFLQALQMIGAMIKPNCYLNWTKTYLVKHFPHRRGRVFPETVGIVSLSVGGTVL